MARTSPDHQVSVFRPLFKGLLLVGLPMIAAIFTCAQPLTEFVLGAKWLDGVVLLRLESVTTLLGLVLTPVIPLLFLVTSPRRVKWIMVGWTASIVVLSLPLASIASFRAISIAQIVTALGVFAIVERLLRDERSYSLLGDMRPGLAGLVVAIAGGIPLASSVGSAAGALAAAVGVAVVQILVTVALGGGADPREILRRISRGSTAAAMGTSEQEPPQPRSVNP
jgi:O-antigen/teichoic acid export membrane protein